MLLHYLRVGWRHLWRHPSFAIINILGLALGLTCCLLMLIYIRHEGGYDRFHRDHERVFRLQTTFTTGDASRNIALTPNIVAPLLQRTYPETVEATTRVFVGEVLIHQNGEMQRQTGVLHVDSGFFAVFDFRLLEGQASQVLRDPQSVVLTASAARQWFGEGPALGQIMEIGAARKPFRVAGIVADPPAQSHLQFTMLMPLHRLAWATQQEDFFPANFYTYLKLSSPEAEDLVRAALPDLVARHASDEARAMLAFDLMPLRRVYLHSEGLLQLEPSMSGDLRYIRLFGVLALVLLLVAVINYLNLTTARSVDRAREVGLRKVVGARQPQLVQQFMGETVVTVLLALLAAWLLAQVLLPGFGVLVGKHLAVDILQDGVAIALLLLGSVVLGALAGGYPALVLARLRPVGVLRGTYRHTGQGGWLRKGLVVVQFGVAFVMIIGTLVVRMQMDYISQRKIGYDKEQVLVCPVSGDLAGGVETLRRALEADPAIEGTTLTMSEMHYIRGGYTLYLNEGSEEGPIVTAMGIDKDFVPTLGVELAAGQNLTAYHDQHADSIFGFLVNEHCLALLGIAPEEALGYRLNLNGRTGEIVGVLRDFHFEPMHQPIGPLVLFNSRYRPYLHIRLSAGPVAGQLARVRTLWREHLPAQPFDYAFLDERFDSLYRAEQQTSRLVVAGSAVAIVLALLGLYGLATYATLRRSKEIGIRKVLGARVREIVGLFTREVVWLTAGGFVLALPLAWYATQRWLSGFAYHAEPGLWIYLSALGLTLGLVVLTVGLRAYAAATAHPADALRDE
ncbi:MAG: ABC transporter permease [Bacteroidia bacterium]